MSETLTKAERKAQKAQAKLEKELARVSKTISNNQERWVICLKYGDKYNADYVNKLFNMVKRHNTMPVKFACMTENPRGLNSEITIIPLPLDIGLNGWWYKPYVFSDKFPISGTLLFLDLDIVIIRNMDNFWNYKPDKFCIIRDFTRFMVPEWKRFNSSVFRFQSHSIPNVWNNLVKDLTIMRRMHGDQDWIFDQVKEGFEFWPDEWCQSYKWEIRNKNEIIGFGKERKFNQIKEVPIKSQTSILVFHGDPKPEDVLDPLVVDNWK